MERYECKRRKKQYDGGCQGYSLWFKSHPLGDTVLIQYVIKREHLEEMQLWIVYQRLFVATAACGV
jgi:hypothetical protein